MRKSVVEALSINYNPTLYKKNVFLDVIKRVFDIFVSVLFICLFLWLFIIIAIIVKVTSKGPIFFGHKRIGKDGKLFYVWKFRTMRVDNRPIDEILTEEQLLEFKKDFKVTNDPRVTSFGKFLRKTSLDELPQFFNILRGNMSIVGWRPIISEELELYGDNKDLLVKVKPGLTGFWASHGRSETSYNNRIKMELYYCVKRSVWLDIRIMWHTFVGVSRHEGAK